LIQNQLTRAPSPSSPQSEALYLCAIVVAPKVSQAIKQIVAQSQGAFDVIGQGTFLAIIAVTPIDQAISQDRQELVAKLLVQQALIESVMAIAPVLPVKFGTLVSDRTTVAQILETGHETFALAFAKLSNKTQYEIVVTWDVASVFADLSNDPAVVALKAALIASEADRDLVDFEPLGRLVKTMLDKRRLETSATLLERLMRIGVDAVVNPVLDDSIILNLALLIEKDQVNALDNSLDALDIIFDEKLSFRCVGPLPPHSFATVEVTAYEQGDIETACALLELESPEPEATLRAAYHRLVKQAHQALLEGGAHKQPESSSVAELKDAYATLLSFNAAGGAVSVSIVRQEAAYEGSLAENVG